MLHRYTAKEDTSSGKIPSFLQKGFVISFFIILITLFIFGSYEAQVVLRSNQNSLIYCQNSVNYSVQNNENFENVFKNSFYFYRTFSKNTLTSLSKIVGKYFSLSRLTNSTKTLSGFVRQFIFWVFNYNPSIKSSIARKNVNNHKKIFIVNENRDDLLSIKPKKSKENKKNSTNFQKKSHFTDKKYLDSNEIILKTKNKQISDKNDSVSENNNHEYNFERSKLQKQVNQEHKNIEKGVYTKRKNSTKVDLMTHSQDTLARNPSGIDSSEIEFHEYCIIGAGPAGLQMGYFLEKTGRDYVIYEKANQSGKYCREFILL